MAAFVSGIGESVGGAGGGSAAPPASSSSENGSTPPPTNRGCLTPSEGVFFHLDYLKLTVFAPAQSVLELVEEGLMERAALPLGGWVDKGPAGRWANIFIGAGPIAVVVPKDAWADYCMVEIKGQGCEACGAEALFSFLAFLSSRSVRWHMCRVDLAFDHVPFTPHQIDAAARAGNFNSRCFNLTDRDWNDSETGQTAYLGPRKVPKSRRLRVYNKRGFTRCEAEFSGDWAKSIGRELAENPPDRWPKIALGFLRGMVDFVDRKADARAERCPLLPWWAELVAGVDRIRNLPEQDRRKKHNDDGLHAIAICERRIIRSARILWAIHEAFGAEYLVGRLLHYAKDKITDDDKAFARELARYKYSGMGGLPDEAPDDDIPF